MLSARIMSVVLVLGFMFLESVCQAAVLKVPSDYSTIQAAIDDCNDGDIVILASGTYTGDGNRDIEFRGKAITVRSESGSQTCIVDCQGSKGDYHCGFNIQVPSDVNACSVIQGLTITGGYFDRYLMGQWQPSSAIRCSGLSGGLAIKDCIIVGNEATEGGGISSSATLLVDNCLILGNIASAGGGVYLHGNEMTCARLSNCIIAGNSSRLGGGIYCMYMDCEIDNCTITGNRAFEGGYLENEEGGGFWGGMSASQTAMVTNSIVWGNEPEDIKLIPHDVILGAMRVHIEHSLVGVIGEEIKNPSDPNQITGQWLSEDPLFAVSGYWDTHDTPNDPYPNFHGFGPKR